MVQTRNLLLAAAVGLPALAEEAAGSCTKIIRAAAGDTCAKVSAAYSITVQQFMTYNPTLRTCTLEATYAYCVSQNPADGAPVEIPTGPGGLIPSPDGSDGVCGGQYTCLGSVYGDCCSGAGYCGNGTDYCGERCNPAFGRCGGGTNEPPTTTTTVCVPAATVTVTLTKFVTIGGAPDPSTTTTTIRGPGQTTTRTTTTRRTTTTTTTKTTTKTTTTTGRPSPTVSGTSTRCTKYHLVTSSDNCDRLSELYGINDDKIDQWNPNFDCLKPSGFVGQYICVASP